MREEPGGVRREHGEGARAPGRIFVDYLRNVRGATSVAAYSTRATPAAPVAVPLTWDELTPRLRSDQFTVDNVRERLSGRAPTRGALLVGAHRRLPGAEGVAGRAVPTRSRRSARRSTA